MSCNGTGLGMDSLSQPNVFALFCLYSCGPSTVIGLPMAAKTLVVDGDVAQSFSWAVSAFPVFGPLAWLCL